MSHLIDRALERYGIRLTPTDLAALQAQLSPRTLMQNRPEGAVYVLNHRGVAMVAVAGVNRDTRELHLRTFLPPDYFCARERQDGRDVRKWGKGGRLTKEAHRHKVEQRKRRRALVGA